MTALEYLLNHDETPSECCDCPFASVDPADDPPNPADPGEGHYVCSLLGVEETKKRNNNAKCWTFHLPTVWGENPLCTRKDWRERAKQELNK